MEKETKKKRIRVNKHFFGYYCVILLVVIQFFGCIAIFIFFLVSMIFLSNRQHNNDEEDPPSPSPRNVSFFHFGDPQIGQDYFYPYETAIRFQYLCNLTNQIKPNLVFIAGDLTHSFDRLSETVAFQKVIDNFEVPVLLAPGNHDINSNATIYSYRRLHGEEYFSYVLFEKVLILIVNSEYYSQIHWVIENDPVLLKEGEKQNDFLNKTLKNWDTSLGPIFVVIHKNPNQYQSVLEWGKHLLDLFCKYNVSNILHGHTHTSVERTPYDCGNGWEIPIFSVGGTAILNDFYPNGYGYRVFNTTFSEDFTNWEIQQEYIKLDLPLNWP